MFLRCAAVSRRGTEAAGRSQRRYAAGCREGGAQLPHQPRRPASRDALVPRRQGAVQEQEVQTDKGRRYGRTGDSGDGDDRQRHLPVRGGQQTRQSLHRMQNRRSQYVFRLCRNIDKQYLTFKLIITIIIKKSRTSFRQYALFFHVSVSLVLSFCFNLVLLYATNLKLFYFDLVSTNLAFTF